MSKGPFLPNEFVPTQFSTTVEKANFGNALLRFLDANCLREFFTKRFYNRLSMTFGHIAHCDIEGFYSTWFTGDRHRLGFVQKLLHWPCHGDPKFTFSDVEHAVQQVMLKRNYLEISSGDRLSRTAIGSDDALYGRSRRCSAHHLGSDEPLLA